MVTLSQSFTFCHFNFRGERGHTAFSTNKFYTLKHFKVLVFYCLKFYIGDMAEAATRPYNLRSREEVVELPVQLHLADDEKFISDLLASDRTHTGQVLGSDSSLNDTDCDALINSPLAKASSSGHTGTNKKYESDPTLSDSVVVSQQVINMQILSQLKSLGRRLDDMEAKNCKKTSDQSTIKVKSIK